MLVQAQALRAGSLSVSEIALIPPLTNLQHLVLNVSKKLTKQVWVDLSTADSLPQLQTLALWFCPQHEDVQPPGVHEYYWRRNANSEDGGLWLARHKTLRHVLLSRVALVFLTLPPGCKLTLEGSLEMCCRTWKNQWENSNMERNLSILHVTTSKSFDPAATYEMDDDEEPVDRLQTYADKLQHIFTVYYPFLTRLYLTCSTFGTADSPMLLGANSPCLTTLRIIVAHESHIFITVSAPVQLEAVRLDARTGTLFVTLEDVVAFAEKLVVLDARYSQLQGDSLRQLAAQLSQQPHGQLMNFSAMLGHGAQLGMSRRP